MKVKEKYDQWGNLVYREQIVTVTNNHLRPSSNGVRRPSSSSRAPKKCKAKCADGSPCPWSVKEGNRVYCGVHGA